MTLIGEQFNLSNRADLWRLRTFHGKLDHVYCDPLGRTLHVTEEHADRLMSAGKNIYVDIPLHPDCPIARYRGTA